MTDTDLVAFLRARYDEETQAASAASDGPWTAWRESRLRGLGDLQHVVMLPGQGPGARASIATASWVDAEHIARHDPARVLAEIEAKRRILDEIVPAMDGMDDRIDSEWGVGAMDPSEYESVGLLRLLALPYAGHPDYRDEWRP